MAERLANFELGEPFTVANRRLQPLVLDAVGDPLAAVDAAGDRIVFSSRDWYEVLLTVHWDSANQEGHRFAHTAIPDHHPLHSEAIDAAVLAALSDGRQLLRGNTIFEPGGVESIRLEVWQDSGTPVLIKEASLQIRYLRP